LGKQVACKIEHYHHMLMTLLTKGQEISRGVDGPAGPFVLGLGENGQTGIVTKALVIMKKWRNTRSQDLLLLLINNTIKLIIMKSYNCFGV